jgi:hypothetical protein
VRESAQSWRELLLEKRRGLAITPELAVADGAFGFWRPALLVHKIANVLNKLPKRQEAKAKCALQVAETKRDALAAFDAFVQTWGAKYDKVRVTLYSFPTERAAPRAPRPCGVDAASVLVAWTPHPLEPRRSRVFLTPLGMLALKRLQKETSARRRPRAVGGELPELGRLNRKEMATLAGLAPFIRQSGQWQGRSFIGGGRTAVISGPVKIAVTRSSRSSTLSG